MTAFCGHLDDRPEMLGGQNKKCVYIFPRAFLLPQCSRCSTLDVSNKTTTILRFFLACLFRAGFFFYIFLLHYDPPLEISKPLLQRDD